MATKEEIDAVKAKLGKSKDPLDAAQHAMAWEREHRSACPAWDIAAAMEVVKRATPSSAVKSFFELSGRYPRAPNGWPVEHDGANWRNLRDGSIVPRVDVR